jgi:ribosomal protein S18 acetylase RimI-like enzyme
MNIKDKELEIRSIDESEVNNVLDVYRACEDFLELGPVPKASIEMVRTDMGTSKKENRIYCGIFDEKNRMVGIVDFIPKNYSNKADQAFLALLMIAKPYRSQGIGARVVKLIESEIIKDKEIQYIYSGVQVNNVHAIKFWDRMGYKIYDGPELLPDKTTVYHLKKRVSEL